MTLTQDGRLCRVGFSGDASAAPARSPLPLGSSALRRMQKLLGSEYRQAQRVVLAENSCERLICTPAEGELYAFLFAKRSSPTQADPVFVTAESLDAICRFVASTLKGRHCETTEEAAPSPLFGL